MNRTDHAPQPAPRQCGRSSARIAVDWIVQRANVQGAPGASHVRLTTDAVLPALLETLESRPDLAAELRALSPGRQIATACAAVSHALGRPVCFVGGCHDYNAKAHHARGNGWGRLLACLRGVDSCAGRTAQRAWASVVEAGLGWRLEENTREEWVSPVRARRDGTASESAGRTYQARRTRSVAYLSAAFLRSSRRLGELASRLSDVLRRFLPAPVKLASRLSRSLLPYGRQIACSRLERARRRALPGGVIAKIRERKRERARAERNAPQGAARASMTPPGGRGSSSTAPPEPPRDGQGASGGAVVRRTSAELLSTWLRPWDRRPTGT